MSIFSSITNIFSNRKNTNYYLVIDIGSSAVKCLVMKNDNNSDKTYIIGFGKKDLSLDSYANGQIIDIHIVAENTAQAIEQAVTLSGVKPELSFFSISGKNVISYFSQAKHVRRKPSLKINNNELQSILAEIQTSNRNQVKSQLKKENLFQGDIELINSAVTNFVIDGTTVKNPLEFTGENLTIDTYTAYAPLISIGALQAVADEIKLDLVSVIHSPYALAKSFDANHYQYKDAIFIDIGGSNTDIAINQNGSLLSTRTFGIGGQNFTNSLASNLNIAHQKAEQYKKDYSDNLLSDETQSQINQLFAPIAKQWLDNLTSEIKKTDISIYPNKIFLCGGGSLLPEILETLSTNWYDQLPMSSKPTIKQIHPVDIENMIDKTTQVNNVQYITPIAVAKISLKYLKIDSVFEKAIKKMMQTFRN